MVIKLVKIIITNFKGIRSLDIDFLHETNIYGDNATFKTSIFDAFLWDLFGKDSTDRTDFEIKTLDANNKAYPRIDHEVELWLDVDGTRITIKKQYKERWSADKGETEKKLKGHDNLYFWNDVPKKESEFKAKLMELIDEKVFKLITNSSYFNSMKWQDRRAVLMQIAGEIKAVDVLDAIATAKNKTQIAELTKALNAGKSIEEFKAELSAKKRKIKEDLDYLPARIQEAKRALPVERDYDAIDASLAQVRLDIQDLDSLLNNKSKAHRDHQANIDVLIGKKRTLSNEALDIASVIKNEVQDKKRIRESVISTTKSELRQLNDSLVVARNEYKSAKDRKAVLVADQTALREKYFSEDAKQVEFTDGQFCCPTCKRTLENVDVVEEKLKLTRNFNNAKANALQVINDRGLAIKEEVTALDTKMENLVAKADEINTKIAEVTSRITELETENTRLSSDDTLEAEKLIAGHERYQAIKKDIADLEEKINEPFKAEDNSALLQRKRELNAQLEGLIKEAATKEARQIQTDRIEKLVAQEELLTQEMASFEGIEFAVQAFVKSKMDMVEQRINSKFQIVKFKMFEETIDGTQKEACTTLVDGVPYDDINTASKVQAGIDIINVLNDHYGVVAPIWIDNRESTVVIPETKSQVINLRVVEGAQLSVGTIKWKKGYPRPAEEIA